MTKKNKSRTYSTEKSINSSQKPNFKDQHINNAYNANMFTSANREDNVIKDFAAQNPEWFHNKYNDDKEAEEIKKEKNKKSSVNIDEKRIKISSSGISREQINAIQSKMKKIIPDKELEQIFNNPELPGAQKASLLKEGKIIANKSICPNFMRNKMSQHFITLIIFVSFFLYEVAPFVLTCVYLVLNKDYNKLYKNNVLMNVVISLFGIGFILYKYLSQP